MRASSGRPETTFDEIANRTHPAFRVAPGWAFEGLGHLSHTYRYIFVATPKVACSSILMTLQRLERNEPKFQHAADPDVHVARLSPLQPMSTCLPSLLDPGYFKWRFVRNPFDRLLSCWKEKILDGPMRPMFEQMLGRVGPVTFEEFIRVICVQEYSEMDSHYAPQSYVTFEGMIPYDFTGRFEQLESDLSIAFARFGAEYAKWRAVIDGHRTGAKPYQLITPQLEALIVDRFAVDFKTFDYSPRVADLTIQRRA